MKWKRRDSCKTIEEVVLRNTGYEKIDDFLNVHSKEYVIKHIDDAANLILDCIKKKMLITIVGDYDADGVMSSLIMKMSIESLGGNVRVRLPKRFSEGYGISETIVDEIDSGLLITVDNGIVAFDAIQKAKDKGLIVLLTDHHELAADKSIPCADVVINAHIPETATFEDYCGAGIAYKIAQKIVTNDKLLKKLSCFAAIATIADVVSLTEENRLIVQEGLRNMVTYGYRTSGLYSLLKLYDLDRTISETDIAFKIGPAINAAGRLYDNGAMKPLEILEYDGPFIEDYAKELYEINEERKKLVNDAMQKAECYIEHNALYGECPLVIEEDIHEGIVGIIAGKLTENKKVPTFVLTQSEDPKILKGSARSIGGIHLKDLLDKVNEKDSSILVKYGGHAEAAGLSIYKDKIEDFIYLMQEEVERPTIEDVFEYDLEVSVNEIPDVIETLKKYAPYGNTNERIIFKVNNYELSPRQSSYFTKLGEDESTVKLYGVDMTAIGFGLTQAYLDAGEPKNVELVGYIGQSTYFGKTSTQIEFKDFQPIIKSKPMSKFQEAMARAKAERYS